MTFRQFFFFFSITDGGQIGPDIYSPTIYYAIFSRRERRASRAIFSFFFLFFFVDLAMFVFSIAQYGRWEIGSTNDHPARRDVERWEPVVNAYTRRGRREERR